MGEQKREVCYTGAYFDPNEKTCKWVGMDKVCVFIRTNEFNFSHTNNLA